jgi:DNA-binding protein HU-beta
LPEHAHQVYGGRRTDDLEGSAMNKGGLVAEVAKRTGMGKAEVGRVVDAAIDAIRDAVVRGDRVTLADFGTFERKHRNERIARNPRKPDVPIVVPARDLPSFTPGKEFRARVIEGSEGAQASNVTSRSDLAT